MYEICSQTVVFLRKFSYIKNTPFYMKGPDPGLMKKYRIQQDKDNQKKIEKEMTKRAIIPVLSTGKYQMPLLSFCCCFHLVEVSFVSNRK